MECPSCSKLMEAPIYQCLRGHSSCSNCKGKVCSVECNHVIEERNYGLESIIDVVKFPCRNKKNGCNEYMFHKEIKQHELCCYYHLYKCDADICKWEGVDVGIRNHILINHNKYLIKTNEYSWCENFKMNQNVFLVWFNELYNFKSVIREKFLYLNTTCLGKQDRAKKCYYEIKFECPNDDKKYLIISEMCSDINFTMDKKIEYGMCIELPLKYLSTYVSDKFPILKVTLKA